MTNQAFYKTFDVAYITLEGEIAMLAVHMFIAEILNEVVSKWQK
jgi:hypothetical protein